MLVKERTSVYDFSFHLVFVTKYRKAIFTTEKMRTDMKNILLDIAKNNDVEVNSLEITPDSVHMLISFKPKYAASSIVKALKGASARAWFKQYPATKELLWKGHLWSPSFFMSTVGNVSEKIVKKYIEDQMKKSTQKSH